MLDFKQFLIEEITKIYYHGTPDSKNIKGKKGIHIGTKLASVQALNSRIGVPADGEWDGTREYGKTLLAGKKTLKEKDKEFGYSNETGFNCGQGVPEEDYYPSQRTEKAKYSDGSVVPLTAIPDIISVSIVGKMSNKPFTPMSDDKANALMTRFLKTNSAKTGYYYINIGEDEGSISAVVPDFSFLKINNEIPLNIYSES